MTPAPEMPPFLEEACSDYLARLERIKTLKQAIENENLSNRIFVATEQAKLARWRDSAERRRLAMRLEKKDRGKAMKGERGKE